MEQKPAVADGGDPKHQPRLLDQVRSAIRRRHYSYRTEQAYIHWIKRFIYFHGVRHPREMGEAEVTAFLNSLVAQRGMAAATQNQALSSILFLYKEVLGKPLDWLDGLVRAKRPARVPSVLTVAEVQRLLAGLDGMKWLMASLLYGAGLRLRECLKLRVKDIDFEYRQIVVRDGKGGKDRVTMLPASVIEPLRSHLLRVMALHEGDLAAGYGDVELPDALARKYPRAAYDWAWKFVFPAYRYSTCPRTGVVRRHHVFEAFEFVQQLASERLGRSAVAGVIRRLPAAGLRPRNDDFASRSLQQPDRGKADARPHQVYQTGNEEADAHDYAKDEG